MLYFAAYTMDLDGGVMVTGSHNPPDYNGFKLVLHKASVFGPDIQQLGRMAAAADYETGRGSRETAAVFDAYVARILQDVAGRSEEHTSELQSLMRISYAVFCLKKKTHTS